MSFEDDNVVIPEILNNDENQNYNMSGKGSAYPVPEIVADKFNWGACLLTWVWGIGNKTYITLLILLVGCAYFIPVAGWAVTLAMQIWFGVKGNEWAWQNKRFESIEAFHNYQKKWTVAGTIIYLAITVVLPIMLVLLIAPALEID